MEWQDRIENKLDGLILTVGEIKEDTAVEKQKLVTLLKEHDQRGLLCIEFGDLKQKFNQHIYEKKLSDKKDEKLNEDLAPVIERERAKKVIKTWIIGTASVVSALIVLSTGINMSIKYAIRTWAGQEITKIMESKK